MWLQVHGAIYRPDSFVMVLRYCANLKTIRYESMSLNRIVADKSHRVIVAYDKLQLEKIPCQLNIQIFIMFSVIFPLRMFEDGSFDNESC